MNNKKIAMTMIQRYKDLPSNWDGYQKLSYALVYSCLETLRDKPKFGNKQTENEQIAIEYADAFYFLDSPLFIACCIMSEMEPDKMRENIDGLIDYDLMWIGDIALRREPVRRVELKLPHGNVDVWVPRRWNQLKMDL